LIGQGQAFNPTMLDFSAGAADLGERRAATINSAFRVRNLMDLSCVIKNALKILDYSAFFDKK